MGVLISILIALGFISGDFRVTDQEAMSVYQQNQQAVNDYATQNSMPIDWEDNDQK